MKTRFILFALLLSAAPAQAFDTSKLDQGGSLPLEDLAPLIDHAPKLKAEISQVLADKHKKMDEIICGGRRFSNAWEELGGARVAPYDCDFAGKWLHIEADVRITDPKGQDYKSPSRAAMKNADKVTETHPVWTWSDKPPADWDK